MQTAELRPDASFTVPTPPRVCAEAGGLDPALRWSAPREFHDLPAPARPVDAVDCDSLFAEFQPLVQRLIRQYGDEPELREDLIGEIYCRFCALVHAYDPSRGIPLRPYLV